MAKRKAKQAPKQEPKVEYSVDREQLGIFHIASKDESRPALSSVALRNGKLCAADGFMMAEIDAPGVTGDDTLLLYAPDLKELHKRTKGSAEGAKLESHKDGTILATADASPKQPVVLETIDATYPELERIFDDYTSKPIQAFASLNADLLKSVLAWLGPVADGSNIQFRVRGPGDAVELRAVTYGGHKARLMIMPMVPPGGAESPDGWYGEGLPVKEPESTAETTTEAAEEAAAD